MTGSKPVALPLGDTPIANQKQIIFCSIPCLWVRYYSYKPLSGQAFF